jgi:hypothetical protein
MTIKLPSQTNAANGRTRSTRASQRFGTLQLWEGPGIFRAGSFARPIYRKEETERFRATSTKKPKQKRKTSMKPPKNAMRPVADAVIFEINRLER